uniref:Cilia and flagella associated protein 77 n=1 Tax=Serinus canaria TaxID=9135 RepID=A0A8C9ML75_SERCA
QPPPGSPAHGCSGPRRRPMTLAEAGPGTENERLGLVRLSMLRNPLIIKPELGKPMRNCYSLPGPDFTYGMYMHKRDGGVPEAIGHWDSVKAKAHPRKRAMPRDFVAMGRGAVDEGCTTARDFALYYGYMDIRCKDKDILRHGGKAPPGMTFGKPPRPSTPLFDLMQHRYKELWMEEQRARTRVQYMVKKKVGIVQQCFPLMCTVLLSTTPHCPTPQGTNGLLPALGRALSWENIPLTTKRLMKPNKDEHPPSRSHTGSSLDISSAQVTCDSGHSKRTTSKC